MPSARFGATRRSWKSPPGSGALDRALTVAAVAYYAAVIVFTILVRSGDLSASGIDSSADELADGQVLRLLTSVIAVEGPLAVPQIALGAFVAAVVIRREGAAVWWVAALVGHVGSALISYAIIDLASALPRPRTPRTIPTTASPQCSGLRWVPCSRAAYGRATG